MARLQILELPEGSNDDRPPFVLVVDQYVPQRYILGTGQGDQPEPVDQFHGIADQIGARAVLVFEDTIDIPANDTTAYREQVAEEIRYAQGKVTRELDGPRLADERTDIARDMDRLANHKAALLDALGMDRTRDWDDIRNAAAGLRKERDTQAAELERLHAGEEPVTDTALRPTPGQWIWQWNRATPEKRLSMATQILASMPKADACFLADHEAQIERLSAEVERLRGTGTHDA